MFILVALGLHCCTWAQAFPIVASVGYSLLRCAGFSLWWPLLWTTASRHVGFRSWSTRVQECGTWAELLHSLWDLPGLGLEPMFPELADGFLTTRPPGKPWTLFLDSTYKQYHMVFVFLCLTDFTPYDSL